MEHEFLSSIFTELEAQIALARTEAERAAVAGTIALCAGFWTEALACFLMLRFDFRRCRRAEPAPVAAAPAQPEQSKEERTSLLSRDEEDGDE